MQEGVKMGIDATIKFKTTMTVEEIEREIPLESYVSVCNVISDFSDYGETHEIDTPFRYYGKHYERGAWGSICDILMNLIQSEKIECVWYGGDDNCTECTIESILETSKYFMEVGNRPYRK